MAVSCDTNGDRFGRETDAEQERQHMEGAFDGMDLLASINLSERSDGSRPGSDVVFVC